MEQEALTLATLKTQNCIIFEAISGSRAYGTDTAGSDTDIRGVFIAPKSHFYSLSCPEQVNDERHNVVYYELRKFLELLSKNNPNILELTAMPANCILFEDKLYREIVKHNFLSKLCEHTFAGYALTQVRKARGLNKKILNPVDEERKSVLDFCFVAIGQGSLPVKTYLAEKGWQQEHCGLVNIAHMSDVFALFYHLTLPYKGIIQSKLSNDISLSSIPIEETPVATLYFNRSGYSTYCKDYKEYWEWVVKRNDAHYQNTLSHGKNYDAKNMLHTFRLLDMAAEIGETGQLKVRRPNRERLLAIRNGQFEYEDLVQEAEEKIKAIERIYQTSTLPETPDLAIISRLCVEVRDAFYEGVIK